ncbi:hypothetical protein RCOM_1264690 [Ricinus communis]|uniref:Uncharacterized protein n=1 Tax=Ricinus communis TaxID=3988 RepID=B9SVH1_RICCO|nr:hypothetical protein RCOM_1264690 [Ricinus communis]
MFDVLLPYLDVALKMPPPRPLLTRDYLLRNVLRTIDNLIGRPLKIDYNTQAGDKGKFARVAVELDLRRPFISRVKVDGNTQSVEYEALLMIYYRYKKYGHVNDLCKENLRDRVSLEIVRSGTLPEKDGNKCLRSWMHTPAKSRKPTEKTTPNITEYQGPNLGGRRNLSRFDALSMLNEDDTK